MSVIYRNKIIMKKMPPFFSLFPRPLSCLCSFPTLQKPSGEPKIYLPTTTTAAAAGLSWWTVVVVISTLLILIFTHTHAFVYFIFSSFSFSSWSPFPRLFVVSDSTTILAVSGHFLWLTLIVPTPVGVDP